MFGEAGRSYINWAAEMAVGLKTGVPWVMCKEEDAPDPIVSGFYVEIAVECYSMPLAFDTMEILAEHGLYII